ncbi:MAG TPA: ankyrin repeat domain-containing protein, partial [Acidobacteria bacterium]|nr:ankyrin repeat domain-containing protein [Acidobacteriota bacterium]
MRLIMQLRHRMAVSVVAVFFAVGVGVSAQTAPLADAMERGDIAAVSSLLKTAVDVNAPQGDGATALHWAAYLDDSEMTAVLIRADATIKVSN